jgi:hypothetical protein
LLDRGFSLGHFLWLGFEWLFAPKALFLVSPGALSFYDNHQTI